VANFLRKYLPVEINYEICDRIFCNHLQLQEMVPPSERLSTHDWGHLKSSKPKIMTKQLLNYCQTFFYESSHISTSKFTIGLWIHTISAMPSHSKSKTLRTTLIFKKLTKPRCYWSCLILIYRWRFHPQIGVSLSMIQYLLHMKLISFPQRPFKCWRMGLDSLKKSAKGNTNNKMTSSITAVRSTFLIISQFTCKLHSNIVISWSLATVAKLSHLQLSPGDSFGFECTRR
jgi:hypothetical protein